MFYFTDNELDGLIMEHLGHFDITEFLPVYSPILTKIQLHQNGQDVP